MSTLGPWDPYWLLALTHGDSRESQGAEKTLSRELLSPPLIVPEVNALVGCHEDQMT